MSQGFIDKQVARRIAHHFKNSGIAYPLLLQSFYQAIASSLRGHSDPLKSIGR
jgi:hypothetical protein